MEELINCVMSAKKNIYYLCFCLLIFVGCEHFTPATSNKIVTGNATDITDETVVLNGVLNIDIGLYDDVRFGMIISNNKEDINNRKGDKYEAKQLIGKDFELKISKLAPNSVYYYSAWLCVNEIQYEFGSIKTFETKKTPNKPLLSGEFSISKTQRIIFSPGNLQHNPKNNTWQFAPSQINYIGRANQNISTSYNDWIDLFGWSGAENYEPMYGVSISTNNNDYYGMFYDWGINKIENYEAGTWRTMTSEEWSYLLNSRENAEFLKGIAKVDNTTGIVLLPDNWTFSNEVAFKCGFSTDDTSSSYSEFQTISLEQWEVMENYGAIFLSAAGFRNGKNVDAIGKNGYYWSATSHNTSTAHFLLIKPNSAKMNSVSLYNGFSVRLVKEL